MANPDVLFDLFSYYVIFFCFFISSHLTIHKLSVSFQTDLVNIQRNFLLNHLIYYIFAEFWKNNKFIHLFLIHSSSLTNLHQLHEF